MSNEKLRYYAQAMTIDAATGKPMPKVAIDGEINLGDISIDDVGISDNGNKLKVNADGSIVAQLTGSKVGLATDPMPDGKEGETYMQYDEATGETKVFKYIGGAWREL